MNCLVTICIFNSDNQPVEIFEQDVPYLPGTWEYSFKVPVHGWRKGEYYFRIYGDGNLLVEKIFRI
jgi:hypothetical protein